LIYNILYFFIKKCVENRKLENERYEQTYKLGDDERFSSIEAIHQFVDERFLEEAVQIFVQMHAVRLGSAGRMAPDTSEQDMEEII
ncbi:MAG: hypothetical protein ACK5Q2_15895, partial [Bacteroidota bacterium]